MKQSYKCYFEMPVKKRTWPEHNYRDYLQMVPLGLSCIYRTNRLSPLIGFNIKRMLSSHLFKYLLF